MPLNDSRGNPSILNFLILYIVGKTKLSKNGRTNRRFFDILSRKLRAVSLSSPVAYSRKENMRGSAKTACLEETCDALLLVSRAQR